MIDFETLSWIIVILLAIAWLSCRSAGRAYGISYYLEFDGVRHYFKANVCGYKVTAPHENAIKEVIFRRLTQAIACRAVDRVIGRLK